MKIKYANLLCQFGDAITNERFKRFSYPPIRKKSIFGFTFTLMISLFKLPSKLFITVSFVLACMACTIQGKAQVATIGIIPQPVDVQCGNGDYVFFEQSIGMGDGIKPDNLIFFKNYFHSLTGTELKTGRSRLPLYDIWLSLDAKNIQTPEGYKLTVTGNGITIKAHDEAGVFYGLQSLLQLLKIKNAKATVPFCTITDHPRFAYRGMHLDVSRHFFKPDAIKKWIDLLALYKINTFHWHLTDDQGWRIEIKKYPLLQSISAYRDETIIGHKKDSPHRFDGKRYGGYYTQDEVKEIVKYATERHITVIPEIEMPGHALAALAAYPQLGCTGGPYKTATYWAIFDDVYCAGNDETFTFLQNVMG